MINLLPFNTGCSSQRGFSLLVALVMLVVLTLIGISAMGVSILELKMAGSSQLQGVAGNRADESLRVGELNVDAIVADPTAFDFAAAGDGFYVTADAIDVHNTAWAGRLTSNQANSSPDDLYVIEYLGAKPIPGESVKVATDGRIIGGAVHTFRITTRSSAAKGALRMVQSIYVSEDPP